MTKLMSKGVGIIRIILEKGCQEKIGRTRFVSSENGIFSEPYTFFIFLFRKVTLITLQNENRHNYCYIFSL